MSSDNQVMLLTPPGAGAIAVVRIVGSLVAGFLAEHFSKVVDAGQCVHGELRDQVQVIDDPVIVRPSDDVADINLHGGVWVVRVVIDLATQAGFTPIATHSDNELPASAVDGQSPLEREMLQSLPLARSELAVRALLNQPWAWREFDAMPEDAWRGALESIVDDEALWWLLHPPRVSIIGAANVGKSTLANQLFAQERSITADLPGTTRDWVGEMALVNGLPILLVDTPGVRQTTDVIEQEAIERAEEEISRADLVVVVLDASAELTSDIERLCRSFQKVLIASNKADRAIAQTMYPFPVIQTVATTGRGVDALRKKIAARFGCDDLIVQRPRWWTKEQREEFIRMKDRG